MWRWHNYRLMAGVDLFVGQGGGVLVGACGFAAVVVSVGDFDVLYLSDLGVLCPVALFPLV